MKKTGKMPPETESVLSAYCRNSGTENPADFKYAARKLEALEGIIKCTKLYDFLKKRRYLK